MERRNPLIVVHDKNQEVGFFGRNFLIRNAMEEDMQEKSRESHAIARDKNRRSGRNRPNLLICNTKMWRARQDSNPRPPGS
jgi:hypothetical protein